jgi:deazaflavin-dependent oxidoreductase (nitroreductase family)
MRRVNKVALNKVTGRLAPWLPGLGIVVHRGRTSGKEYRTPVNVFPRPGDRYVLALTYGPDTDWIRNVIAADGCELLTRGAHLALTAPRLFHDKSRREIRAVERAILGLLHVYDFLELYAVPDA